MTSIPGRPGLAHLDALVGPARAGDRDAFDSIYGATAPLVWRLSQLLTGSRADAERVLADTYARVLGGRLADGTNPLWDGDAVSLALAGEAVAVATGGGVTAHAAPRPRPLELTVLRPTRGGPVLALDPASRRAPVRTRVAGDDTRLTAVLDRIEAAPPRPRAYLWLALIEGFSALECLDAVGTSAQAVTLDALRGLSPIPVGSGCSAVLGRLAGYVHGRLPAAAFAQVRTHLDDCGGCRSRVDLLARLSRRARLRRDRLPATAATTAAARWSATLPPPGALREAVEALPARGTAAAAVAVLLVGGGAWLLAGGTSARRDTPAQLAAPRPVLSGTPLERFLVPDAPGTSPLSPYRSDATVDVPGAPAVAGVRSLLAFTPTGGTATGTGVGSASGARPPVAQAPGAQPPAGGPPTGQPPGTQPPPAPNPPPTHNPPPPPPPAPAPLAGASVATPVAAVGLSTTGRSVTGGVRVGGITVGTPPTGSGVSATVGPVHI